MDQGYFRDLLSTSSQKQGSSSTSRGSLLSNGTAPKPKPGTISSSEAAFKPRKVKKSDRYRDRAAERRLGEGNDYAEVEALLEDFQKTTADQDEKTVEEKRRYLGGDGDHSILVKGLDMALLEQNKAKAAMETVEDDELEAAFREAEAPKKRTREDIVRELKEKRTQGADTVGSASTKTDAPAAKGKFKPIGFKPIGAPAEDKPKKRKAGEGEKKKKKKRKVEAASAGTDVKAEPIASSTKEPAPSQAEQAASKTKEPSPEPPDDFDIFADAGEYEGVDLGNDDEGSDQEKWRTTRDQEEEGQLTNPSLRPGHWFAGDDDEDTSSKPEPIQPVAGPSGGQTKSPDVAHPEHFEDEEGAIDEPEQIRLVPLESSSVPSIKDILAMDEAAGLAEKKKKRKEKQKNKKGGSEMSAEAKANRDYQRLKSYTDKRGE
ncbi:C-24(28) sterol reductase [Paramarasmius palmivorus]|uniref:C-24(28) sterol reductase n=1 Tax=Paramarasmius palmivorus TaxID=297713 RepID=A0AAW0E779_9AGAR